MSKINALEARLDALSEQALHAAAREAAQQVFENMASQHETGNISPPGKNKPKELPDGNNE